MILYVPAGEAPALEPRGTARPLFMGWANNDFNNLHFKHSLETKDNTSSGNRNSNVF